MTIKVTPLSCGSLECDVSQMVAGEPGRALFPVPSYLIEHPNGVVVFDAGMHKSLKHSKERIGPVFSDIFNIHATDEDDVGARVAEAGVDPGDVDLLVLSHLHFDHSGGVEQLPNARIVIQESEWEAGHRQNLIDHFVYNPEDFDLGHEIQQVDGAHDIFGDGTVRIVPTPGHTAGHQSLGLTIDDREFVLTADACYVKAAITDLKLPGFCFNKDQQLESLEMLRRMEAAGATLIYGHDPEQWPEVEGLLS